MYGILIKNLIKMSKNKTKITGISKDMLLGEVVAKYPETVGVMLKHGMHCVGCHISFYETIEQGALVHGMTDKEITVMISEMNKLVKNDKKWKKFILIT